MISEPGFEERGIVDRVDKEDENISASGNNISKEIISSYEVCSRNPKE